MRKVFADANYWIGLLNPRDQLHPIALAASRKLGYAMFDVARSALLATDAPTAPELAKTHGGLITAFSLHLVKTGRVPVEFGKALNRVADIRLVAACRKWSPIYQIKP